MLRPFNKKPRHADGFTLVELLLAITLMSILLGLTYSGLRAATRSSERGEKILAAGGELRAAHQFMRRQLNQMLPLPFAVIDGNEEIRVVFEGDATRIRYVAPMPGYLGSGGPQVQLLEVMSADNGDLVVQFSHALLQGFEEERLFDRDPVILLEGVDTADFEFLGKDENGEVTGWTTSWEQQGILPTAVRLNLEFSGGFNLRWPEFVAGDKVDAQAVQGAAGIDGRPTYERTIQDLIQRKAGTSHDQCRSHESPAGHSPGAGIVGVVAAHNYYGLICPDGANGQVRGQCTAFRDAGTFQCRGCNQPCSIISSRSQ